MHLLWLTFLGGGAAVAVVESALLARRWPHVYLACIAVLTVWPSVAGVTLATPYGLSIRAADVLVVVSTIVAASDIGRLRRNLAGARWAALGLVVMIGINVVRGYLPYGQAAGDQARSFLIVVAIAAFFLSLDLRVWAPRMGVWLLGVAGALTLLVMWHVYTRGIGTSDTMLYDASTGRYDVTGRVVTAGQALVVALAALVGINVWSKRRGSALGAMWLLFVGVTVIAQQRSVWAAFALGLVIMLSRGRRTAMARVTVALVFVAALMAPLLAYGPGAAVVPKIAHSVATSHGQHTTISDRQQSWTLLVSQAIHEGPETVTIGQPFGTPWTRDVQGRLETYSPHNWYVTVFLRTGVIGSLAFLGLLLAMARRRGRSIERSLHLALLAAMAAYMVAYSVDMQEAPLLALLLAVAPMRGKPAAMSSVDVSMRLTALTGMSAVGRGRRVESDGQTTIPAARTTGGMPSPRHLVNIAPGRRREPGPPTVAAQHRR